MYPDIPSIPQQQIQSLLLLLEEHADFIDTNVFFNHGFLRAPLFELLANYVSNEGATVLVSDVVCEEMNAKFRSERAAVTKELAKGLRRATDFQSKPTVPQALALDEAYDFRAVLTGRFKNLRFVPFESVPHALLVSRAINATRPFRDSEKGYRDSLMWLSLLSFMKEKYAGPEDLIFINANANDFFKAEPTGTTLHPDLEADRVREGIAGNVRPFLSLKEFADAEIDRVLHSIKHEEFEDRLGNEMEELAAEAAISYLQQMPLPDGQKFLEDAELPRRCARALRSFSVEDYEGVEDPEVLSLSALAGGVLYVQYRFNLLTVMFTAEVSTDDYLASRDEFDEEFINIDVQERITQMQTFRRIDFDASFTFNPGLNEFTSIAVDQAVPRPLRRHRLMAYS
ncbi:MAG: PIN domain-containing protein [Rhodocyclaceae bacterium]